MLNFELTQLRLLHALEPVRTARSVLLTSWCFFLIGITTCHVQTVGPTYQRGVKCGDEMRERRPEVRDNLLRFQVPSDSY